MQSIMSFRISLNFTLLIIYSSLQIHVVFNEPIFTDETTNRCYENFALKLKCDAQDAEARVDFLRPSFAQINRGCSRFSSDTRYSIASCEEGVVELNVETSDHDDHGRWTCQTNGGTPQAQIEVNAGWWVFQNVRLL